MFTGLQHCSELHEGALAQVTKSGGTETLTYLHTDHLATPRYGTNAAGSTVWTWDSGAFGKEAPTGTAIVNLRFPGQYYDSETTLHYNWNRYYNPAIGRYLSSDPIGLQGGLNTFGYVTQSPLVRVDPLGLDTPNYWDQINPGGIRGQIVIADYREWYELRFPLTLAHAKDVIWHRIVYKLCLNPGRNIYPGLYGAETVDVYPSRLPGSKLPDHYREPYPDRKKNPLYWELYKWWIGVHQFRTEKIHVNWSSGKRFTFNTVIHLEDTKGAESEPMSYWDIRHYLTPHTKWGIARWPFQGQGCCSTATRGSAR